MLLFNHERVLLFLVERRWCGYVTCVCFRSASITEGSKRERFEFSAKVTLNVALNGFCAFTDPFDASKTSQRNLCNRYTFIAASLGLLCGQMNDCEAMRMMEFVPSETPTHAGQNQPRIQTDLPCGFGSIQSLQRVAVFPLSHHVQLKCR